MRLLSLDFDGVLHRAGVSLEAHRRFEWLPILVQLLEPWPDVRLAVHSTWRYDHTLPELAELLGPLQERFIGATPPGQREDSILWYSYQLKGLVTDVRVLDDAPNEFSVLKARLIVCDPATGLSAPEVQQQLRAWLSGEAVE